MRGLTDAEARELESYASFALQDDVVCEMGFTPEEFALYSRGCLRVDSDDGVAITPLGRLALQLWPAIRSPQ